MKLNLDGLVKKALITTTAVNMFFAINTYANNLNNNASENQTPTLEKTNSEHEIKYDENVEQKNTTKKITMEDIFPEILLFEYKNQKIPLDELTNNNQETDQENLCKRKRMRDILPDILLFEYDLLKKPLEQVATKNENKNEEASKYTIPDILLDNFREFNNARGFFANNNEIKNDNYKKNLRLEQNYS